MSVRDTSLRAYDEIQDTGRAHSLRETILDVIAAHPAGITRKAISEATGLPINTVAGRVNELLKADAIAELPAERDLITGRSAHPVTALLRQAHCKNCGTPFHVPRDIEPPVLGFLCGSQCERENREHYE